MGGGHGARRASVRVPARDSESGDILVSFGEPIGHIDFDALTIDAREARQECDTHPERAPAEVADRIRNETPLALWGTAAGRLRRVGGVPGPGPPEGERRPHVARGSGPELAVEPALSLEAVSGARVVSEPDLDPELPMGVIVRTEDVLTTGDRSRGLHVRRGDPSDRVFPVKKVARVGRQGGGPSSLMQWTRKWEVEFFCLGCPTTKILHFLEFLKFSIDRSVVWNSTILEYILEF